MYVSVATVLIADAWASRFRASPELEALLGTFLCVFCRFRVSGEELRRTENSGDRGVLLIFLKVHESGQTVGCQSVVFIEYGAIFLTRAEEN